MLMSIREALIENFYTDTICLSSKQIGMEMMKKWESIAQELYSCGQILYRKHLDMDYEELRNTDESTQIYELLKDAYSLIGEINGYRIIPGHSEGQHIMAFAMQKCTPEEPQGLEWKHQFNVRLERHLAGQIIVHLLKDDKLLQIERNEQKIYRRVAKKVNQRKERQAGAKDSRPTQNKAIHFVDHVVICHDYPKRCGQAIAIIDMDVETINVVGTISTHTVPVAYDDENDLFYLRTLYYQFLKSNGLILCQILSYDDYKKQGHSFDDMNLKPESLLHRYGYNVSSADNLSNLQRQEVLKRVVYYKLYTSQGIINFLSWLIELNKKAKHKNMSVAISRWTNDIQYVQEAMQSGVWK